MKFLPEETGEAFFLERVLAPNFDGEPCVFDVGANLGEYSRNVRKAIPNASIYAFEPNTLLTEQLKVNVGDFATVVPMAVGSDSGVTILYNSCNAGTSEHGSVYRRALIDLHGYGQVTEISVPIITLDEFAAIRNIEQIDFLKIDTEGHELAVLRGCQRLLKERRIRVIQFEFNEMNIVSRVFMSDFVSVLDDFVFFRLDTASLHPIHYTAREEIFAFQNIVAVKRGDKLLQVCQAVSMPIGESN